MRFLWISLLLVSNFALGSTVWTKSLQWDYTVLESVESALRKAADRSFKDYPVVLMVKGTDVAVSCDANQPQSDLSGCHLVGSISEGKDFSLSYLKPLSAKILSVSVKEKLAKTDPNTTDEHLHFGSIFAEKDGSHYFCQPEGETGEKKWVCYHLLREQLNPSLRD